MNRAVLASKLCTTCGARYAADALFCPSDGTPLSSSQAAEAAQAGGPDAPDAYLGREISGHIEIRQLAGVGAMGRVYRAFQKGIDRDVAVKILHRELSANQQLVARFHREAKVASRLQHPNVVQVHLAGQLPDGAMYIVMEYLDGLSLQSALAASGGSMPLPRAMHVGLQLCDAAGEAHAQGVVHRDLKPENVMLVRRGEDPDYVKVLDFGIARLNWGEQSMATAAGLIFGTARYISPEGAQGEQVGPPGDVYSIATLLYQMLAGRTPFEGDQAVALLVQQIHDAPPPLRSLPRAGYVPEAIAQVVMRNLAKDPGARDPDARTLGRALIEAAKASGMSPDDLVVRSGLISGRGGGAMQMAPMQRTKQLQLSTEVSERLAQMPGTAAGASGTAFETPSPPGARAPIASAAGATEAPHFPRPGTQSAPTTKWTPPPGFSARLSPPRAAPSEPGVDQTLDDESAPIVPALGPGELLSEPPPEPDHSRLAATEPPRVQAPARPLSRPAPTPPPLPPTAPPTGGAHPLATAPGASMTITGRRPAKSGVDTTLSDEDASVVRRRRSRAAALVFFCFLLGAGLAVGFAYRSRIVGSGAAIVNGTLDDQVARAGDALKHKRWDEPPGDNVRDLTTEGLARWPGDARLLEVRVRATDELVKDALGKKFAGDPSGALHLARLARELDPSDTTAQQLTDELEKTVGQVAPTVTVPIKSSAQAPSPHTPPPPIAPGGLRVALDASTLKPRVGQQVDFVAKIASAGGGAPKQAADDPYFQIVSPSGLATRLPAAAEGTAVYKATFSFLEAGRYDVIFNAKTDGAPVRAARTINAGAPTPPPPEPPTSSDPVTPPPAPSGKWL